MNLQLRFIEKGAALYIRDAARQQESDAPYNATFYELYTDSSFLVQSRELCQNASSLGRGAKLNISYLRGSQLFAFSGRISDFIDDKPDMILIDLISGIQVSSRRKYNREEMRLNVRLFGLSRDDLDGHNFKKTHDEPVFSSETFDISAGGLCLVSNSILKSEYEPYFLAEFSLGKNAYFLLPSKLLRKGNSPQTTLHKYDYGFAFLFDNIPEEKNRLIDAIFKAKFEMISRR